MKRVGMRLDADGLFGRGTRNGMDSGIPQRITDQAYRHIRGDSCEDGA